MARIRSIKPDFFKSETIATLPLSARLTFIGLWTHVDDNGVTIDNAKLITAAIWPLEDDPTETLKRTHEDLMRLDEARLIVRYEVHGKRYTFIRGWFEHQKPPHPSKPRYPLPAEVARTAPKWALNSENTRPVPAVSVSSRDPHEDFMSPPDVLTPEQGTGNREQGTKTCPSATPTDVPVSPVNDTARPKSKRRTRSKPEPIADDDPRWIELWAAYPKKDKKIVARQSLADALAADTDFGLILRRLKVFADKQRRDQIGLKHWPMLATWLNQQRWEDEDDAALAPPPQPARPALIPLDQQCRTHMGGHPANGCRLCAIEAAREEALARKAAA